MGQVLDAQPTMGQRLSRAKAKIAAARIPFAIPCPEDLPDRLNSVLTVVYLIFTAGYTQGPQAGTDLAAEAVFLARLLVQLAPDQAEVEGALALLLLTHARAAARTGPDGLTLSPAQQDRSLWDGALLVEGLATLADLSARLGRASDACAAYAVAIRLVDTAADRAFLQARLLALG